MEYQFKVGEVVRSKWGGWLGIIQARAPGVESGQSRDFYWISSPDRNVCRWEGVDNLTPVSDSEAMLYLLEWQ